MTAWEYFVAPLLEHNPGDILNTFGDDGWELVSVVQQQTPMGTAADGRVPQAPQGLGSRTAGSEVPADAGPVRGLREGRLGRMTLVGP